MNPHHWTPEHLDLLKKLYPTRGGTKLEPLLGRCARSIIDKASKLKIGYQAQGRPKAAPKLRKPTPVKAAKKPAPMPSNAKHRPAPDKCLKPLVVPQANRPGSLDTPILNARVAAKKRAEQTVKQASVLDELKKLPANSEGRRIYALAARQGGAAASAAFRAWQQTQQPA